jgi:hypothetical protein
MIALASSRTLDVAEPVVEGLPTTRLECTGLFCVKRYMRQQNRKFISYNGNLPPCTHNSCWSDVVTRDIMRNHDETIHP